MKKIRKTIPLLAAATSLLMAAAFVIGAAAARDPFIGSWSSVDSFDGSNQTLHIGGGPGDSYHVVYFDDGATVCGLDENGVPIYGASAKGWLQLQTGPIVSSILGDMDVYCLASPPSLGFAGAGFQYYEGGNNTLVDQYGTIWTRGH